MAVVLALMGPTAAGKTGAALRIAAEADVDIVSVDSAMVYRRLDIGTAKPPPTVLARHPHALVDIAEPTERYSAARFLADADAAARRSLAAGRTPLLVGGTMLYFQAFKHGLDALPAADAELRAAIAARAVQRGWPALHGELAARDPAAAKAIDPHNGRRIQRALEVHCLTGQSITDHWGRSGRNLRERLGAELVEVAIVPESRQALHRRIEQRVDEMLALGLVDEVRRLRAEPGTGLDLPALRSVGYRQVWEHLDGVWGHAAMTERIKAATRQLAKRQLTWLRRWQMRPVADAGAAVEALRLALARRERNTGTERPAAPGTAAAMPYTPRSAP